MESDGTVQADLCGSLLKALPELERALGDGPTESSRACGLLRVTPWCSAARSDPTGIRNGPALDHVGPTGRIWVFQGSLEFLQEINYTQQPF